MKLITFLTVLFFLVSVFAEPNVFLSSGKREPGDVILGSYYQKQGPFPHQQNFDFDFKHSFNGNKWTSWTLAGPTLSNVSILLRHHYESELKILFRTTGCFPLNWSYSVRQWYWDFNDNSQLHQLWSIFQCLWV